MSDSTNLDVASILTYDTYKSDPPNDTGAATLRRAAVAIETIARLVSNSIRGSGDAEPVALSPDAQAGLLDALELVALGLLYEAHEADTSFDLAQRYGRPSA